MGASALLSCPTNGMNYDRPLRASGAIEPNEHNLQLASFKLGINIGDVSRSAAREERARRAHARRRMHFETRAAAVCTYCEFPAG